MSGYESNYIDIGCPFCDYDISINDLGINNLDDEQDDFFRCPECDKFFKVTLQVFKSYDYIVETPTDEEVKKYKLFPNQVSDIIIDAPGQNFMWDDLFPDIS